MDNLTASIVTYATSKKDLTRLLTCCINNFDVIYIVDHSDNNDLEIISSMANNIVYIYGQGNIGYGSGHNIAIKKAIEYNSTYHVILNPDIYFENGTIESIYDYAMRNSSIGLIMPKILYPTGETQYLCKLLPTPYDLFARRFIPFKSYVEKKTNLYELKFTDYNTIMDVPSLSGCFMFIKMDILKQVGGFDERFFMYAEDMDLCRRIGEVSRTVYYPLVTVYHEYAKESYENIKLLKYHIQSIIKYFNKWGWFFDSKRSEINKNFLKLQR